jgi:hypothetical protein
MNHDLHNGPSTLAPLPARTALDTFFLDARARLLDLAAILDRIDRGGEDAANDPRLVKVRLALEALCDGAGGRAERIQQIFSLTYDPTWERPQPR